MSAQDIVVDPSREDFSTKPPVDKQAVLSVEPVDKLEAVELVDKQVVPDFRY